MLAAPLHTPTQPRTWVPIPPCSCQRLLFLGIGKSYPNGCEAVNCSILMNDSMGGAERGQE